MNQQSEIEKRRYTRKTFENQVAIHQITGSIANKAFFISGKPILGRARDISADGIQLHLPQDESLSHTLRLSFELEKSEPLEIYSKQVWKRDTYCGLQFIIWNANLRKQLEDFLAR